MREKENEAKSTYQSKAAKVPRDECSVERIVLDRQHMRERGFLEISELPLVSRLRRRYRSVLRHVCSESKNAYPLPARRCDAEYRRRVVVFTGTRVRFSLCVECEVREKLFVLDLCSVRDRR